MASAGELLRSERLKQGRTLAEIAAKTCISRRYLEAIETDSPNELPGEFFYKAFIRQYADALGLDPDETDRILASIVAVSEPDPVPILSQAYDRAHAGDSVRWRPSTGVAIGLLIAVVAGGSLMYAWWQRVNTPPDSTAAELPVDARHRTLSPEPSSPVSPAVPESTPPPPQPASSPQAASALETEAQPLSTRAQSVTESPNSLAATVQPPSATPAALQIAASEPAWVEISSEGKTIFIGTLDAGQSRHFPIAGRAALRTGNAGALEVQWRGQPVGPLGPRGQIRVVRFTPEGAEVVTPAPKIVPDETPSEP